MRVRGFSNATAGQPTADGMVGTGVRRIAGEATETERHRPAAGALGRTVLDKQTAAGVTT